MRNLTVKRVKSFVASLMKMKVYIEDPASGEITINGTPCRKLGDLKNGEEKTFQIGDQALKVFVIADKLSKGYCNEYYQLPEGQADVSLVGKNQFNPANGNAFRFENNFNPDTVSNRKRGTRIGLIVLIAAVVIGLLAGFLFGRGLLNGTPKEKTFSAEGMSITLTNQFKKFDAEGFTVGYDSRDAAVLALKEPFTLAPGLENYTLEQYADLVIQANGLTPEQKKTADGQPYLEYDWTNPELDEEYHYTVYPYKSGDAFWTVQFATLKNDAEKYAQQIAQWAKTVEFDNG